MPKGHDPIALRELFSPGFLDWATTIDREVDFGASDRQLYFLWRLRELTRDELELALDNAGHLFRRVRAELEEDGVATYPTGPLVRRHGAVPGYRLRAAGRRSRQRRSVPHAEPSRATAQGQCDLGDRTRAADPGVPIVEAGSPAG